MDLIITILPVVTKDLPISPRFTPFNFLSRCKFSTLTTRQPMVEFYLLTFPRFPLQKKEHKSYFGKNRTHDFRTSRCVDYLLDHSDLYEFQYAIYKQSFPSGNYIFTFILAHSPTKEAFHGRWKSNHRRRYCEGFEVVAEGLTKSRQVIPYRLLYIFPLIHSRRSSIAACSDTRNYCRYSG